jgi:hypothetical protein
MCSVAASHPSSASRNTWGEDSPLEGWTYNIWLLAQAFHVRVIRTRVLHTHSAFKTTQQKAALTLSTPWRHRMSRGKAPVIIQLFTACSPNGKSPNPAALPQKESRFPLYRSLGGPYSRSEGQLSSPTQPTGLCNYTAVCLLQAETELFYSHALI